MRTLEIYQADAFTADLFGGNPAAVCILESWLPVTLMQAIAAENNLSETAFAVPVEGGYEIRWFTPAIEVALCGHATLATAHILFETGAVKGDSIRFFSRERGELSVDREGEWLVLDFPQDQAAPADIPEGMVEALGTEPQECMKGLTDYLLIFENQAQVEGMRPDHGALKKIRARGVIVSAPGDKVDFVSRFFAPGSGIDEDPVTGSAHTMLTPYWAARTGKNELEALQRSQRGGYLRCALRGDRVRIGGRAVTYMKGTINLPENY